MQTYNVVTNPPGRQRTPPAQKVKGCTDPIFSSSHIFSSSLSLSSASTHPCLKVLSVFLLTHFASGYTADSKQSSQLQIVLELSPNLQKFCFNSADEWHLLEKTLSVWVWVRSSLLSAHQQVMCNNIYICINMGALLVVEVTSSWKRKLEGLSLWSNSWLCQDGLAHNPWMVRPTDIQGKQDFSMAYLIWHRNWLDSLMLVYNLPEEMNHKCTVSLFYVHILQYGVYVHLEIYFGAFCKVWNLYQNTPSW